MAEMDLSVRRQTVNEALAEDAPVGQHEATRRALNLAPLRLWATGVIDSRVLPVVLVCDRTGSTLGRPAVTVIVEQLSQRVLGHSFALVAPGPACVARTLSVCARRFGLLPEVVVVDNSAEYRSVALENFLDRSGVRLEFRPPYKTDHRGALERFARRTDKMLVEMRRRMGGALTLPALEELFTKWAYEIYDSSNHPALGCSPREAYERAVRSGDHAGRPASPEAFESAYDLLSAQFKRRVMRYGLIVNGICYRPAEGPPLPHGENVQVRCLPGDLGRIEVLVSGAWTTWIAVGRAG